MTTLIERLRKKLVRRSFALCLLYAQRLDPALMDARCLS